MTLRDAAMNVRQVKSADELRQYVAFAAEVYRDIPAWVPPDEHQIVAQLRGQSFGRAHSRIQPFWVEDNGRILATVTAMVDDLFNAHWGDAIGHVLFFEALPDHEAASRALLDAACDWLIRQGCTAARVGFLYGWQLPLTIDAYDEVPTAFHTINPPYYHRYIKDAGFFTECGAVEYIIDFTPELAGLYERMVADAVARGVVMRPWRLSDPSADAELFSRIYNATFGAHWGAPQFTVEDCHDLITELGPVTPEDFTVFADAAGQTVGAVLALPDINQALHRLKNEPGPPDAESFATALAGIDHGMLISISVLEPARGTGLNLAMAARVYLAMMARGYCSASYTTVLDTNRRSRRTAEKLGGRIRRNFVVYRRDLG
jgi:GNAT superfamily N-acetyltransferase